MSIGIVSFNLNVERIYTVGGFAAGGVFRSGAPIVHAGGKGVNLCRTLDTLGATCRLFGCVGGVAGRQISRELRAAGIPSELVHVSGESRSCLVVRDPVDRQETVINEPGQTLSRVEVSTVVKRCERFIGRHAVIVFSGSVMPGITPRDLSGLIRFCRAAGKPVIVDITGEHLKAAIAAGADIVKPNQSEWETVCGKRFSTVHDIEASVRPVFNRAVRLVAVSRGAKGALFIDKNGCRDVRVPRLKTVNAVGCGDALAAGIAAGIAGNKEPQQTVRYACAVAAASSLTELPGVVRKKDIAAILRKITERLI